LPDPVFVALRGQLLDTGRPRIVCKRLDPFDNAFAIRFP
jgi:hypothetical protein